MEKETPEQVRDRLISSLNKHSDEQSGYVVMSEQVRVHIEQTYQLARIADALENLNERDHQKWAGKG